ncbi:tetratricopeptide repeat-containing sensor histidine kinase [Tenacibaculum amylolyticum]|uniref:tetratricopeptide repeat-containing sensor histidine kinase n=1 Tax=Tenacibaculum amylolyticum TaxID=104269 RepID=UPI00389409F1
MNKIKSIFFLVFLLINLISFSQTEDATNAYKVLYNKASQLCENKKEDAFCKAFHFFAQKKYDSCIVYSNKALLSAKTKKTEHKNILNYIQGTSYIRKKLYKKALLSIESVIDSGIFKSLRDEKLGRIYLQTGNYRKSISFYKQFIKLNDSLPTKIKKSVFHNLGVSYLLVKEYQKAREFLDKEFELINKTDTISIIGFKTDLANIYYEQYIDSVAIPLFKEAYDLATKISSLDHKRRTTYNLAIVEKNRKNYKKSLEHYQQYIKIKDSINNRDRIWELAEIDKKNAIKIKEQEILIQNKELRKQQLIIVLLLFILGLIIVIMYLVSKYRKRRILLKAEIGNLKAVNEERKRISEELHDGILSKLFGIRMNLGFINYAASNEEKIKYHNFLEELNEVEKEIRQVSHKLGNEIMIKDDFISELTKLIESKSKLGNFAYEMKVAKDVNWSKFSTDAIVNIYRVLQEVFQNIVKHSKAKNVLFKVIKENNNLIINVKDDGIGFNIKEIRSKGIGIKNIDSRTNKIGGLINISSKISVGSNIMMKIPYK